MQVLSVKRADCKNCYKCVRVCPVKAIRIKDGQAEVDDARCILCGRCWQACPQHAKQVISELQAAKNMLQGTAPVLVSLAPSLVAAWPDATPGQLVTALLRLGFDAVSQTSVGATLVNQAYQDLLAEGRPNGGPWLSTACPAVVNMVERHYPALVSHLAPVPSPLIVHARLLKRHYPGAKVVFVGPCIAKMGEVQRPEFVGLVDAVLMASELGQWLEDAGIVVGELPESEWSTCDQEAAVLYPQPGGLLHYLSGHDRPVADAAGLDSLQELLEHLCVDDLDAALIECNACQGGCLDGPDMPKEQGLIKRQERLQQYNQQCCGQDGVKKSDASAQVLGREDSADQGPAAPASSDRFALSSRELHSLFDTDYRPHPAALPDFPEEQIRQVLGRIGKFSKEDELNCEACGYPSCRDKAKAVLAGMAEPDMCMPFMRTQAESLANEIMRTIPNGLIVVDENLVIREFNRAAERMWQRQSGMVIGHPLSVVMPDEDFLAVQQSGEPIVGKRVAYPELGLITVQSILTLEGKSQLILGMITDVTEMEKQTKELAIVKEETLRQAQSVIDNQMRMAQEIAGLLGEVTADSKILLMRLIELVQGEGE